MFKIGEFSKLTQISIRMLRYYDEAGLLKPAETDPSSGYRLYSADQIPLLNQIVFLRDLGFSIAEMADALQYWDASHVERCLERKQIEIETAVAQERRKLAKIELAKRDLQQKELTLHCNVSIRSVPAYRILSLRRVVPDYYSEGLLWKEMVEFAQQNGCSISNQPFAVYHDSEYKESDVDIEICSPVKVTGPIKEGFVYRTLEPVPVMACTMVRGPFRNIAGAYLAFANWLKEHNQYRMAGQTRQIVHRGPWNETRQELYLTEIQIPLEERGSPKIQML